MSLKQRHSQSTWEGKAWALTLNRLELRNWPCRLRMTPSDRSLTPPKPVSSPAIRVKSAHRVGPLHRLAITLGPLAGPMPVTQEGWVKSGLCLRLWVLRGSWRCE